MKKEDINKQMEEMTKQEHLFLNDIKTIAHEARHQAYRATDHAMVVRNWLIGWRIVEQEQNGKERAEYGRHVLEMASQSLTNEFGKGFGLASIRNMRQFYLKFKELQIRQALLSEFKISLSPIRQAMLDESQSVECQELNNNVTVPFYPNLSWMHYERLMRVEDEVARIWYLKESAREQWDYRTLQRNISSQYYYRMMQTPENLRKEVSDEMHHLTADFEQDKLSYLKNPIIAEFLGLPQNYAFSESKLETSIINHLQKFIMELGKGYAFVARQQHIKTDMGDFYIDLVFYNIILKCYLIIDLKTNQITHQDIGQMDMYIRMYDELKKEEGNNPTIGLLLCSDTSKDLARYSILKESKQLFAAKYLTTCPLRMCFVAKSANKRSFLNCNALSKQNNK